MKWIAAAVVVAFTLVMLAGLVTGRVRARPCCEPDPARDLRTARRPLDDENPAGTGP